MVVGDAEDDLEKTTYQLQTSYISPGLLSDLDKAIQREWIMTNGLGGYTSSTATCLTTTRRSGLGTLSEIFDADPPHTPRGCISQAWSVAEPLRAYMEDILLKRPPYEETLEKGL